jgi:hypothetical protein
MSLRFTARERRPSSDRPQQPMVEPHRLFLSHAPHDRPWQPVDEADLARADFGSVLAVAMRGTRARRRPVPRLATAARRIFDGPILLRLEHGTAHDVAHLAAEAALEGIAGVILPGEPVPERLGPNPDDPAEVAEGAALYLSLRRPRWRSTVHSVLVPFLQEAADVRLPGEILARHGWTPRRINHELRRLDLTTRSALALGRALRAALLLQARRYSTDTVLALGYEDESSARHQILARFGLHLPAARQLRGVEWLLAVAFGFRSRAAR